MRTLPAAAALAALAVSAPLSGAATVTFSGTCTARGTATITGGLAAPTYVVVNADGWCTGVAGGRLVHARADVHAEATPSLGGLLAFGFADLRLADRAATFRVYLHHVTPAVGVDSDGHGGYAVTTEMPTGLPSDVPGGSVVGIELTVATLTPIHGD